jgi:hypothetical protein
LGPDASGKQWHDARLRCLRADEKIARFNHEDFLVYSQHLSQVADSKTDN